MPLILAIEPERRQAAQLKRLVHNIAGADLVLANTTELALEAIGDRIPDLVLVPALLSPQDDSALATALRVIAAAAHVQTLTIPVFAATVAPKHTSSGGVLSIWRRNREQQPVATEGCDPDVFAEQIAAYLAEAAATRQALHAAARDAEEYNAPQARAIVEPIAAAPSVDSDVEQWADPEPWPDPPRSETAFAPYTAAPVDAEDEPAPTAYAAASDESTPYEQQSYEPTSYEPAYESTSYSSPSFESPTYEPAVFERSVIEPIPAPEPARAAELATELFADSGSEWETIALSDPDESSSDAFEEASEEPVETLAAHDQTTLHDDVLVSGELDLGAFLAELEEKRPEPDASPIVQQPAHAAATIGDDLVPARKRAVEAESWRGLSLAPHRWPRLEGVLAELPKAAAAPDAAVAERDTAHVAEPAAVHGAEPSREVRAAARPESGRSEWLDMLDALRHDIERLRAQRTEAGVPPAPPAPIEPVQPVAAAPTSRVDHEAAAHKKARKKKEDTPVQDEWGFFDPQQCGFTALLAKLDEISSSDEAGKRP